MIDGTGAPAVHDQTILIEGDRITAVGPSGSVRVPVNAEVVDLSGHTVIPGLVGLHDHSYYTGGNGRAAQLSFSGSRLYLASGVTTIRTTGAQQPYAELNLKREIDAGYVIGPTMFTTGPYLTGEQGSLTMARLEGPEHPFSTCPLSAHVCRLRCTLQYRLTYVRIQMMMERRERSHTEVCHSTSRVRLDSTHKHPRCACVVAGPCGSLRAGCSVTFRQDGRLDREQPVGRRQSCSTPARAPVSARESRSTGSPQNW